MPSYYDSPGLLYDSGVTYDGDGPTTGGKKVPAEVAYNLKGLEPREVLTKIKNAHDAVLAHAATFPTPNPTLASVLAAHDAASALLDSIDAKEQELEMLRTQRDAAIAAAVEKYRGLGSFVENKAAGNPAVIQEGGYDVAQPRGATLPMPQVQNNVVTAGDNDGEADGSWDAVKGRGSYELQSASAATGPWAHQATVTASNYHFTGKPSGQKLWTRVRAINKFGPGPWSDPACCTVP